MARRPRTSDLEASFDTLLRHYAPDLPAPVAEFLFAPPRRFRGDRVWQGSRVIVELQGAVWSGGAHGRGSGITRDCDKARHAAAGGWRIFPVTSEDLRNRPDEVFGLLRQALSQGMETTNR